ncbi:MAG: lipoprotein insertase outer membrane protein LolB [Thiohalomonadales bacterium]
MKFFACVVRALGFLIIIQLAACTTVVAPDAVDDPDLEWFLRQSQLNKINFWDIKGRLAVINEPEVWHLSVSWKQQQQKYKIHLSGPFGAGAVLLTGDQNGVVIKSGDEITYARDAEQLLYQSTGIQIPIQNLFYWVRGLPNPKVHISNQKIDAYGRLKELSQNDWIVRFKRYKKNNNIDLPSKVFIKKKSLDIRFVIESWSISG